MDKQALIALGLTEEQATKVLEQHKEDLKGYIPKSRFDEVNDAKKKAEETIKERDTQITELSKIDATKLQEEITRLQTENKTAAEKYEQELKETKLTNAIKLAITGKAQDEDLVAGLFDKTKLILGDDGKITGLDEQLKTLQESKGFLFKQEEQPNLSGFKPNQSNKKTQGAITKEQFAKMSYKAKVELYNTNRTLYDQLSQN